MKGLYVLVCLLVLVISGCCSGSCCGEELSPPRSPEVVWLPSTLKAEVKNDRLEIMVDYGDCDCGNEACLIKPSKRNLDFLIKELNQFVRCSNGNSETSCFSVLRTEKSKAYLVADEKTPFPIAELREFYPMTFESDNRAALRVYYVTFVSVAAADSFLADTEEFLLSLNEVTLFYGRENMVAKPHRHRDEKTAERMFFLDQKEVLHLPKGLEVSLSK